MLIGWRTEVVQFLNLKNEKIALGVNFLYLKNEKTALGVQILYLENEKTALGVQLLYLKNEKPLSEYNFLTWRPQYTAL